MGLRLGGDPSVTCGDSVSLRLGHGAALACHRHAIHSRAAASLPYAGEPLENREYFYAE